LFCMTQLSFGNYSQCICHGVLCKRLKCHTDLAYVICIDLTRAKKEREIWSVMSNVSVRITV
jgi:hypothetical protein